MNMFETTVLDRLQSGCPDRLCKQYILINTRNFPLMYEIVIQIIYEYL